MAPDPLSPVRVLWVSYSTSAGASCLDEVEIGGWQGDGGSPLSCNVPLPFVRGFVAYPFAADAHYAPAALAGVAPARADTLRLGFADGATASVSLRGPLAPGVPGERMFVVVTGKRMPTSATLLEHRRRIFRVPL